mmetsp:Transcript_13262/g.21768  ORF Transcript_13262/g.21768 Transcript_13262/m.21768 type:complete len:365 (+) Transcript_13262:151-1245(+)|eukprot:CAMPEP_0184660572 /NCGR_PEP_ID=MMETSP0308-20130426/34377_1 /TAXON_ID=38269 /ORGANISM="Gloeochaete witrockiana, Strain SAG 46.84" /LENGTH=364 /DNA_ID=CAMNT_0027101249 /DNA_START=105 /DNA_END=1199 /DNA_ORIENTATION=-
MLRNVGNANLVRTDSGRYVKVSDNAGEAQKATKDLVDKFTKLNTTSFRAELPSSFIAEPPAPPAPSGTPIKSSPQQPLSRATVQQESSNSVLSPARVSTPPSVDSQVALNGAKFPPSKLEKATLSNHHVQEAVPSHKLGRRHQAEIGEAASGAGTSKVELNRHALDAGEALSAGKRLSGRTDDTHNAVALPSPKADVAHVQGRRSSSKQLGSQELAHVRHDSKHQGKPSEDHSVSQKSIDQHPSGGAPGQLTAEYAERLMRLEEFSHILMSSELDLTIVEREIADCLGARSTQKLLEVLIDLQVAVAKKQRGVPSTGAADLDLQRRLMQARLPAKMSNDAVTQGMLKQLADAEKEWTKAMRQPS